MKRLALLLLLALLGCPSGGDEGSAPPVAVGQRYRFSQGAASATEQVFEVLEVSSEGVLYRVTTLVGGEAEGEPAQPLTLRFPPAPAGDPPADAREVRVGPATFTCRVDTVGSLEVLTALEGGGERFPGVVQITCDGAVSYALIAIE